MKINVTKAAVKRAVIIIVAVIFAAAVIGVCAVFASRSDLRFRVKELLKIGRKDVEMTAALPEDIKTEELLLSEFKEWENVCENQAMLLVNPENKLAFDFEAWVSEYRETGVIMNSSMCDAYGEMSDYIREEFDVKLLVMSSYRTAQEQAEIENEKGSETAAQVGASEHQTGLSLDVYVSGYAGEGFIKSDVGQYVNSHCQEYGFIIRYPQAKEDVTGIRYEPWHIRYVGLPHSEIIYSKGIALEEYFEELEIGEFYISGDYIFTRQKIGETVVVPSDCESYTLSEDNTGCVVITGKRK